MALLVSTHLRSGRCWRCAALAQQQQRRQQYEEVKAAAAYGAAAAYLGFTDALKGRSGGCHAVQPDAWGRTYSSKHWRQLKEGPCSLLSPPPCEASQWQLGVPLRLHAA